MIVWLTSENKTAIFKWWLLKKVAPIEIFIVGARNNLARFSSPDFHYI